MNLSTIRGGRHPQAHASRHHADSARHAGKIVARACLSILAFAGVGLATLTQAEPAHAAPAIPADATNFQIINGSWYLHPGNMTDTPTFHSAVSDLMPTNTVFAVQCVTTGDFIGADGNLAASGGDDAWEFGVNSATGNVGFVSDQGLNTPTTQGQEIGQLTAIGIPLCQTLAQTLQPATSGSSLQPAVPPGNGQNLQPITPPANPGPATPNMQASCYIDGVSYFLGAVQQDPEQTHDNSSTIVCVRAALSAADTANNRVYVSTVEADIPYLDPSGCSPAYLVEIWGDGFYQTTDCTDPTVWNIDKWLAGGTNVCAAISSAYDTGAYNTLADAEAAVKAGQAPLGSADPWRTITCVPITA